MPNPERLILSALGLFSLCAEMGCGQASRAGDGGTDVVDSAAAIFDIGGHGRPDISDSTDISDIRDMSIPNGVDNGSDSGTATAKDAGSDAATDGGVCAPVVAAADRDPWSMRVPTAGFGGIVTTQANNHTDVFLKSPTDLIRVGARLDWGGTVVFFGLSANPASNVIDANDTGRELQVALYDPTRAHQPCAATATCLSMPASCANSISYLGWDPVQGGDKCGHGAKVLAHGQAGDALQVVVQPLQWNPDWDAPDCRQTGCGGNGRAVDVTFTTEMRFVHENVVEVMTEVKSNENFSHPITGQEFPTLYVSHGQGGPDLPLLVDAGGNPVTLAMPGNDGFFYGNFTSPGPWVTWQNMQQNYGVALGHDAGLRNFQGWRGDGNTAPYFHNVRAQTAFGINAGGLVRGISYLALGSFATVKDLMAKVLSKRPPFGVVDAPASGAPTAYDAGKPIAIAGWVLDDTPLKEVRVEIDGAAAVTIPVAAPRADVCAVYPGYTACPNVGYAGTVPTMGLSACPHLVRVKAVDADGNTTVLGERVIVQK